MFFRNLTLFRFSPAVAADLDRLDEALADHRLRPCGPLEMGTRGFVPPVGRGDDAALTHSVQACTLFTVGAEDKMLPASVVNDELQRKVQKIAEEEDRRVSGRERKRLKEDLLTELLPRAFVRSSRLSAYVDKKHGWVVLDTSSRKAAEQVLTRVREALGSFPAVPLAPEEGPRVLMTDWLATGDLPGGLALGDECELRDPATATGPIWRGRRSELDSEEVKEHLRAGMQVFKLGLVFDDRMSFVLGEDLVVRKLKFLDVVLDELGDTHQDAAAEMDARLALLTLELERLLAKLEEWFGLPSPADAEATATATASSIAAAAQRLSERLRADGATATLEDSAGNVLATFGGDDDGLLAKAIEVVRTTQRASISTVQRHLRIGYNRAARLIEEMEKRGIVGAPGHNGAREVLTTS
jgi:recombination associated protein RdgC